MGTTAGDTDFGELIALRIQTLIRQCVEIEEPKVHFGEAYQITLEEMPCISVEIGPDRPADPDGLSTSSFTDSFLQIDVDVYDRKADGRALKNVLKRRSLIHAAVMADFTLGLPFVINTVYAGATAPISDDEGGLPGWYMRVSWIVHYRFNLEDRTVFG